MWIGHMGNLGFGGMLVGGIVLLIFWGGLITITVLAIRAIWNSGNSPEKSPSTSPSDPLEIASQRYARGDISRDEFLELKQDLED